MILQWGLLIALNICGSTAEEKKSNAIGKTSIGIGGRFHWYKTKEKRAAHHRPLLHTVTDR